MKNPVSLYKRYRFPAEIIQYAVWLYYRFNLSYRDIEDLLAEKGILVSYEAIRLWSNKFGPKYSRRLRRSYLVAHRELIPDSTLDTSQYANNQAELSHQPTRFRERGKRRLKSVSSAQPFLSTHAAVYNLFNLGRHHLSAKNFRMFRL